MPLLQKSSHSFGQAHVGGAGPKRADKLENGHKGEILCLAASEDGKYLVSGGRDKLIGVWDVSGDEAVWVRGMAGHKDAVTVRSFLPLEHTHTKLYAVFGSSTVIQPFVPYPNGLTLPALDPSLALNALDPGHLLRPPRFDSIRLSVETDQRSHCRCARSHSAMVESGRRSSARL